jgi:putative restriction endonuclease
VQYWWVNQNQTFTQEVGGGYLWSPKRRADGARNYFYDTMTYVEPGDLVFSFKDTLIQAIGIIQGNGYESPKPEEFGTTGGNWSAIGWRVDVSYTLLPEADRIRPKAMIERLAPLLPEKYSPLRATGDGIQSVYLTEVPAPMADLLLSAIGPSALAVRDASLHLDPEIQREMAEEAITYAIERSPIEETTRKALVAARVGQGRFRADVMVVEPRCRITGVEDQRLLVASHIRPWHRCPENEQRLDRFNGLMLTPTFDRMFDRGLLTFEDNGDVHVSPTVSTNVVHRIGLDTHRNVGSFRDEQLRYLEYHREHVFRQIA